MKKNNKGESLIGILIGVIILSIIILGISNILILSSNEIKNFREIREINILKSNLKNIVENIDTSSILENEIFYIYKNNINNNYEVYTGSTNYTYKYINDFGEKIDANTYIGSIFSRELWLEREDTEGNQQSQIIKASIKKLVRSN